MSLVRASRSLVLFACLTLGCRDGGSSTIAASLPAGGPSIHFIAGAEVTRTFLPERVEVRLTGLPPESRVTLRAAMPGYASHATFRADAAGSLDVASQAPEEGTYQGVDAEGLFWSMAATGAAPPGDDLDVEVRAEVGGVVMATATLARYATDPGVVEEEVRDDGLVGVLALPATPGPHPALLTFGGSEGGIAWARRAALLHASLGYASLGLAYFRAPALPARLDDVPLEYFGRALAWLRKRPEVKADAVGVVGVSRGGELALLLGAHFPEVKAVVAQVPSGVVWPGDPTWPAHQAGSWTLDGDELPYVPLSGAPIYTTDGAGHRVEVGTPMVAAALSAASPAALDAATTRVEDTRGPVLMTAGADDQIWPSCRLARIAWDRLVASGHAGSFADDFVCHPEAGHAAGTPGLPTTDVATLQLDAHTWLAFGGTPAGIARAARDGFERRRAFLARALR